MTNAKKIKSLRDGDKPFELHFERGEVIAGRDQGLAKMSVGERAKLTISPVSLPPSARSFSSDVFALK